MQKVKLIVSKRIGYKKSILKGMGLSKVKVGRGSASKNTGKFSKQCSSMENGKALNVPSSTVHNIKKFEECG